MPKAESKKLDASFHEKDKWGRTGEFTPRRYRDFGHFCSSLFETLKYAGVNCGVYLGRTIDPRFREKIMLTSAITNRCPT